MVYQLQWKVFFSDPIEKIKDNESPTTGPIIAKKYWAYISPALTKGKRAPLRS